MKGTPIVASSFIDARMRTAPGTTYRAPPPPPPAARWMATTNATSSSEAIATTRAPPGSTRFVPVMRLGALVVAELASDDASRGGEMVYVAQCVDDGDDDESGGYGGGSAARCGLEALRCAATARGVWLDATAGAGRAGRASGTRRTDAWAEKAYGKPRVVKRREGKPPSVSPESASEGGGASSASSTLSTSTCSSSSSGPTPSEAYRAGNGRRFPATKPVVGGVSEKKRRETTTKTKKKSVVGVDPAASRSKAAGKPPRSTRREKSEATKSPETPLPDDGARRVVPENPPRLQSKSTDAAKRSSNASSSSSSSAATGKKPFSTVDRIKTGARKRMLRRRVESVQQSFWEFSAFLSKHARTLDQRGGGGFHDVTNAGIVRRLRERVQATQRQRLEHDSVLERMPVPIPPPEHLVGAFDPSLLTKCACPKAETYEMDKDAIHGYDFFAETCPCERCLKTFARALRDRRCVCPRCLAKYSETVHANPERRNASGTARKLFEIDDDFEDKWTRIAESYSGAVGAFTLRRIEQLLDKLKTPILCLPAASA